MKFIARADWQARPARYRTAFTPSFGTTIHYEGPKMGTFPHASCAAKVRGIQNFHMDARGWADTAYTCIVCPHGYVFECRWIGARTGANGTNQGNNTAYAICALIGQGDPMPTVMVDAIAEVTSLLRRSGRAGSRVNGHRDWKPTACPGDPLYGEVRAGRFVRDTAPSTPNPNPTEEAELMAVLDDVKAAIAASEKRVLEAVNSRSGKAPIVRDSKSGRVYVLSDQGKMWIRDSEELALLVFCQVAAPWPNMDQGTKSIPKVDPKMLDDLPEVERGKQVAADDEAPDAK